RLIFVRDHMLDDIVGRPSQRPVVRVEPLRTFGGLELEGFGDGHRFRRFVGPFCRLSPGADRIGKEASTQDFPVWRVATDLPVWRSAPVLAVCDGDLHPRLYTEG